MRTAELVTHPSLPATSLASDVERLLIYVVYDPRGDVEQYIPYALTHLRAHCTRILVVVNGTLTDAGRAALEPVADEILVRENRGYDIWGYKDGLDRTGADIARFDEVILANDTWFGPVGDFAPVFARMDARPLHFWGMTDHVRVEPNPFTGGEYLAYHLQSYWMAVRRDMFMSAEWVQYWKNLPALETYSDAVAKHEAIFTEHFVDRGFVGEVAFPTLTDKIENHAVLYAEQLIDAGCPTLKRRPFFQWPPFMDRLAVIGAWTLQAAERHGYPAELIMKDLARNVAPKVLNADAALLNVIPDVDNSYDHDHPLRVVVIAHIFYTEMTDEILDRADHLPGAYDIVITTPDDGRADEIRDLLAKRELRGAAEVRVVASNNGRDQSAFLIGCRDVLLSDRYDIVVKVHSKKTPQDSDNVGRHFKEQQFDNLLPSPGHAAGVLALFQREPGLGLAFPPMVHLGHPTLGHGWWANKPGFMRMATDLGIRVPVDDTSPLAPYGSMFFARPEALRILSASEWTYESFGGADAYRDGGLAHILERLPVYAAAELGFHSRTIANPRYFASSYTALEYTYDQVSTTIPGTAMEQIEFLHRVGDFDWGTGRDFVRIYARLHRPSDEKKLLAIYDRAAPLRRAAHAALRPLRWALRR